MVRFTGVKLLPMLAGEMQTAVLLYYTLSAYDRITLPLLEATHNDTLSSVTAKKFKMCPRVCFVLGSVICSFLILKGLQRCVGEPSIKPGASHFLTDTHLGLHKKKAFHAK